MHIRQPWGVWPLNMFNDVMITPPFSRSPISVTILVVPCMVIGHLLSITPPLLWTPQLPTLKLRSIFTRPPLFHISIIIVMFMLVEMRPNNHKLLFSSCKISPLQKSSVHSFCLSLSTTMIFSQALTFSSCSFEILNVP